MVTALTDCPVRCRTFGALRRTHVNYQNSTNKMLCDFSSKLLLTDNNYQSYQSFTIKIKHKNDNYWNKIGKIGNYCQFKRQRC